MTPTKTLQAPPPTYLIYGPLEYKNLFFSNDYEKIDKIILKYFQQSPNKLKCIVMFAISI